MKTKLLNIALMLCIIIITTAQLPESTDRGMAKVQTLLGKEIYVLCEPVRPYDVVDQMTTTLTTVVSGRQTIQKQMQSIVNRANDRVERGKIKPFDAVLTTDGDIVVLIKFK